MSATVLRLAVIIGRTLVASALLAVNALTAQATRYVAFGPNAAQTEWPDSGDRVVRVYFDKYGDLYPPGPPRMPNWAGFVAAGGEVSLYGYLRETGIGRQRWAGVRARSGAPAGGGDEAEWRAWQDTVRGASAARLNALLRTGPTPATLVVLVHGFNVTADDHEAQFAATRRALRSDPSLAPNAVFLQVAWDGTTTRGWSFRNLGPLPGAGWRRAQYNAPLVGLELRRLLAAVDTGVPVRVVAHSLGALVVGTALWDASGVFDDSAAVKDSTYRAWRARVSGRDSAEYRFPGHSDIRVGMVAPATSSELFERYAEKSGHAARLGRLVVGLNERDFVTNKGPFGWFKNFMGATALGASRGEFCDGVAGRYPTLRPKAHLVDLYEPDSSASRNREHAWTTYARRADYPGFLRLVFTADTAAIGDQRSMCGTA